MSQLNLPHVVDLGKSTVWDRVPEGCTLILGDRSYPNFSTTQCRKVKGTLHAKNQLDSCSRLDTIPARDGQTHD